MPLHKWKELSVTCLCIPHLPATLWIQPKVLTKSVYICPLYSCKRRGKLQNYRTKNEIEFFWSQEITWIATEGTIKYTKCTFLAFIKLEFVKSKFDSNFKLFSDTDRTMFWRRRPFGRHFERQLFTAGSRYCRLTSSLPAPLSRHTLGSRTLLPYIFTTLLSSVYLPTFLKSYAGEFFRYR